MEDVLKKLRKDQDGLETYEYIANNIGKCDEYMPALVENIINVDRNGQFAVSTARYLNAINKEKYADNIDTLIKANGHDCIFPFHTGKLILFVIGGIFQQRIGILIFFHTT